MSEDPTEHAQEQIHHHATHGEHGEHGGGAKWITAAACSAAVIAVFAALAGSQATAHLNRSMHFQLKENDQWSFYQAKSLKNYVLESESTLMGAMGKESADGLKTIAGKVAANDRDKQKIKEDAERFEALANDHMETHETFETATTLFHISIAVLAIAVVAKRREFWYLSMVGGVIGVYFFTMAHAHAPTDPSEIKEAPAQSAPASAHAAPAESSGGH